MYYLTFGTDIERLNKKRQILLITNSEVDKDDNDNDSYLLKSIKFISILQEKNQSRKSSHLFSKK